MSQVLCSEPLRLEAQSSPKGPLTEGASERAAFLSSAAPAPAPQCVPGSGPPGSGNTSPASAA